MTTAGRLVASEKPMPAARLSAPMRRPDADVIRYRDNSQATGPQVPGPRSHGPAPIAPLMRKDGADPMITMPVDPSGQAGRRGWGRPRSVRPPHRRPS